ncbi:MAG: cation diffusion facilitator family transporter [Pseudobdellovibrio sp.]
MNNSTKVAFFTLVISVVVLALKAQAYYSTYSLAVMSDALETVVNVITALVALFAVKIAAEPADDDHPYGHGKLEYFSASFEGGLILFAALAIIFESAKSFFSVNEKLNVLNGNTYLIIATVVNLATGMYLTRYGANKNSEALKASGQHILSDVYTTVGVLVGLVLVKMTGIAWIDSLVGLLVGLILVYEAYKILRTTSGALLDAVDLESVDLLAEVFNRKRASGIIDIHHLRIIRSGNFHHIDAHVVVPEYFDVATVHGLTHNFELEVVKDYKYDGEIAFHIDPCKRSFCKQCELAHCEIRKVPFEKIKETSRASLTVGPQYTN